MNRILQLDEVIDCLKRKQNGRSVREFAIELGVSASYLSDIYTGKKEPGPRVLSPMGLERRNIYVSTNRSGRKQRGNRSSVA